MAKSIYELSNKTFVNPYHFIPLERECNRTKVEYENLRDDQNLKTGWIECELETLTPTFIPNTTNDDFFKERQKDKDNKNVEIKSYDFFSYQDNDKISKKTEEAIIPGSSIRGTIRSAFETLTNSCMSTIDKNHILYKRVTTPAKPGRLITENGQWKIVECEKYMIKTQYCNADPSPKHSINNYEDKEVIYFKVGGNYKKKHYMPQVVSAISKIETFECNKKGYLHKGEPFGRRKHHESIFVEKTNSFNITEKDVINLLENYILFQDDKVNYHKKTNNHEGYKSNINNAKNVKLDKLKGSLIYYAKHNGKYYLSPAAIGREVFQNRLSDLIGSYSPCTSNDYLCPACAIFGFAGNDSKRDDNKKKNAIASRIRFSDAKSQNSKFLTPVILPELAGPKESSTELYMKKPEGKDIAMWNYDYAECKQDRKQWELNNYKPQIQGRKFYWHHDNMKTFDDENLNRFDNKMQYSDRLVKVRPVDKGVKFSFKVNFNQITEDELKKLLWTLTLGKNDNLAHKIGMGKPVGLGSVKIKINKIKLRKLNLFEDSLNYELEDYTNDFTQVELGSSEITKLSFEKITNFAEKPKDVYYPYCIDDNGKNISENYEWFVGNKVINGVGKGTNHVISENLPSLLDKEELKQKKVLGSKIPSLCVIEKLSENSKSKTYSSGGVSKSNNNFNQGKVKVKEKTEVEKIIEVLNKVKIKEVKKNLKKLSEQKLNQKEINLVLSKLKNRSDAKNKYNPMVNEYFALANKLKVFK